MNRIGVNFNPVKPKGRKILSRKTALGRPIPVITGMGGVLRDIESKNAQKIDELSQGVLTQGKVISEEITKQSAIALNAIDAVKSENTALYNELGSHILANNPHGITKETVGLGRVDNTADFEKPVSIAVGMALDQKADKEELKTIEDRIEESIKEQEKIKDDISKSMNIIGGVGGESLVGGKKGQVLKKVSNKDGDYTWQDDNNTKVHNELEERYAENCHPISAIDGLETALESKYDASNPDKYQENVIETIKVNGTAQTVTSKAVDISVPTNNNQLTNGAGYITGIDSSMVTTALGYTPYDSSNPNGYTSNVGTVTSVNNTSPDANGNVSISIPTVNNPTITITQGGVTKGSFTLNQSSGDTIALDAAGSSYTAGDGIDITSNVISNTGVRSVSTGTNNGTISVDTNGTSAEVSVAGLGSAAFKSMTSTYDSTGTDPVNGTAVASAISDRADKSLSNLSSDGTKLTVRTGMILPYDGSSAPSGWLKCDGSAKSRTTYADLFAVIGTTYGSGNGSTTFNLPSANDFPSGYPSTSYSSVTLGSSGTVYTAAKNGWYSMYGQASANGQYILMTVPNSSGSRVQEVFALSGEWIALSHPVRKGDKICVQYSLANSVTLRFFADSGRASIIKT